MSVKAWAIAASQDLSCQESEHQPAIHTFQRLLEGKINPETAALEIASLYEPLIKRCIDSWAVDTLWGILCGAVRALGGNQELNERLINLLNSLSQLPNVTDEQGNAITPAWSDAGVYWRDLPELAIMFKDYGMGKPNNLWTFRAEHNNLLHEQTSSLKTKKIRNAAGLIMP